MKYESELINEILEQRGHEVPNLHYQSECIETWIKEYRGAYPKLCDYESEWINYIVENPIGGFPYETVTTNNTATINNVVPFEYKSAILKGQTLVNLAPQVEDTVIRNYYQGEYVMLTPHITPLSNLKANTKYTVIFKTSNITNAIEGIFYYQGMTTDYFSFSENIGNYTLVNGHNKLLFTTTAEFSRIQLMFYSTLSSGGSFTIHGDSIMILEGAHTQEDIAYFEGMQSVKMPVLTTTGKNLFDGEFDLKISNTQVWSKNFIKVLPNTDYIFSHQGTDSNRKVDRTEYYNEKFELIGYQGIKNGVATPNDCHYIKFRYHLVDQDLSKVENTQLEQGTTATSYEPYKSNILTVNEDVELRGIGDVKDTLDCLTGKMTERIGEIVLDGSSDEVWSHNSANSSENTAVFYLANRFNNHITSVIMDKFIPYIANNNFWVGHANDNENHLTNNRDLAIRILKSRLTSVDINGFRQWLSENPVTVQHTLPTPIVKTVDLSVVNQDGETLNKIKPIEGTMHINVSGATIAPTAVLEVPVEAITQNLSSFIEEE